MGMNTKKVIVGGLVAGVVILAIDFIVNGFVLAGMWEREMGALNPDLAQAGASPGAIAAFSIIDLIIGLLVVWLYAAIRPRFGAGPATAVRAAAFIWIYASLTWAAFSVLGIFSWAMFGAGAVSGAVMLLVGALVGAAIYKEETPADAAAAGGVPGGSLGAPQRGVKV